MNEIKYIRYLINGLGYPTAAHVSVTLSPFSAVKFFGGTIIKGADHLGWVVSVGVKTVGEAKLNSKR